MSDSVLYLDTSSLLVIRFNYISLIIQSMAFGTFLCLSLTLLQIIVRRRHVKSMRAVLAHSVALFMIVIPWYCLKCFVDGRIIEQMASDPDRGSESSLSVSDAVNIMLSVCLMLLTFCVDLLLLWRAYVIWKTQIIVLSILLVAYVGVFATGLASFIAIFDFVPWSAVFPIDTAYLVASMTFNVLTTGSISIKMLRQRRRLLNAGVSHAQASNIYTSLTSIFIESAALYTLAGIAATYFTATSSNYSQPFTTLFDCISFINPALIQLRLVQRENSQSSSSETNLSTNLPPLEFLHSLEGGSKSSWASSNLQLHQELE